MREQLNRPFPQIRVKFVLIGMAILLTITAMAAGSAQADRDAYSIEEVSQYRIAKNEAESALEEESKAHEEEIGEKNKEIVALQAEVAEKDEEIKRLKRRLQQEREITDTAPAPPPAPPTGGTSGVNIPNVDIHDDDDINIPGWLCPTRFC